MEADLKMHPDTDNPALNGLVMIGMMYVTDGDKAACSTGSKVFNDRGQKRLVPLHRGCDRLARSA
jgi:hypothetical protein